MKKAKAKLPQFPCGHCGIGVRYSGIKCTGPCCNWYHAGCVNISDKRLKELKSEGANIWTCNGCTNSSTQQHGTPKRQDINLQHEPEEEIYSSDSPSKSSVNNEPQFAPNLLNTTPVLNNSLADIELSLVESNFLEDTKNEEDKLEMAAKIGTTLLEKIKVLEETNFRLNATVASAEEKLEEFEETEKKYVFRIESLSQELRDSQLQLNKEKEFQLELQNIFEEQDKKSQQVIDLHLTKIKTLEMTVIRLQESKCENTNILDLSKTASTQTPDDRNPPPVPQSLSVHTEILLLKKRQDQMEQSVQKLSDNIHHHCCNDSDRILPAKHSSPYTAENSHKDIFFGKTHFYVNKSGTGTRRKTKSGNLFSVSLQVAKNREANTRSDNTRDSNNADGEKPTTLIVAPLIHRYEDGSVPTHKTNINRENLKINISPKPKKTSEAKKYSTDRLYNVIEVDKPTSKENKHIYLKGVTHPFKTQSKEKKFPPFSAQILEEGETFEEFLNKNIDKLHVLTHESTYNSLNQTTTEEARQTLTKKLASTVTEGASQTLTKKLNTTIDPKFNLTLQNSSSAEAHAFLDLIQRRKNRCRIFLNSNLKTKKFKSSTRT